MRSRRAPFILLAATAVALSACSGGGGSAAAAPKKLGAAEPAVAPPTSTRPAGTVMSLDPLAEGMVFDPVSGLLAVAVRNPDRLALVNGATGALVTTVPLPGHARHLQLAAPGGPVLVPDEDADRLVEVSLPAGQVVATVPVGKSPHDAGQVSDGEIVVGNEFGHSLSIVRDGAVVATLDDVVQPGGVAALGTTAGVVDVGAFTLSTYDVPAQKRTAVVPAGAGPTHVVTDSQGRFLVADTRGDAVLAFSASPLRQVARLALPGAPYGVTYDPARRRMWVTLTARNQVVALSTAGAQLTEVARYPTVRQPNTVAVDPSSGRVFVSSAETGQLELIDPTS